VIGIIGALFYILGCWALDKLHIDDVVEATPIHLGGGIWGLLAVAFFDTDRGVLYGGKDSGSYLGYQILGIIVIFAWVTAISFPYFYVMKIYGKLRLSKSIEIVGLDIAEMGGVSEHTYKQLELQFGHHMTNSRFSPKHTRI
jgi:Amt family ammonium transporter